MSSHIVLKRHQLPFFKQLPCHFDVEKILQIIRNMPDVQNDLTIENGYGDLVGGRLPNLQRAFGLSFESKKEAYEFLKKNDMLTESFENLIVEINGKYQISNSPYRQIALTEYNPQMKHRLYEKKIPKSKLDERHYNRIVDWVSGTYIEEVLTSFKSEYTRARIAIMNPGAYIDEHIDYNTDYSVRYHIPLTTNSDCGFYIVGMNNVRVYQTMQPGECWFLNQGFRHCAWNKGKTARAHIIISMLTQDDLM